MLCGAAIATQHNGIDSLYQVSQSTLASSAECTTETIAAGNYVNRICNNFQFRLVTQPI